MGYNTTVVIMNDALDQIEKDPQFGKNLSRAIQHLTVTNGQPVDVYAGNHCNAATAIESHHADGTVVVAVGQNYAEVLNHYMIYPYGDDKKLAILKKLADEMGYDIHRKRGVKHG